MVQQNRERFQPKTIAIIAVVFVAVVVMAVVLFNVIMDNGNDKTDPYVDDTPVSKADDSKDALKQEIEVESEKTNHESKTNEALDLDPANVATVDITPLSITVSYVKGVGSFEYEVLRTTNGTRYVAFSNPELMGTKCTNDMGVFASILVNPGENEKSTVAKSTSADGNTYGLSLEPATCTSDTEKLQAYQKSFSDAFNLLKKMN